MGTQVTTIIVIVIQLVLLVVQMFMIREINARMRKNREEDEKW